MNYEQKQTTDENLFPVFRFDLENRLVYANVPALPLMKFWKCRINERIPGEVINRYPEMFHTALSHKPMDVTVEMNSYTINFSIVPFPEAGYIGMYAYSMQVSENFIGRKESQKTYSLQ